MANSWGIPKAIEDAVLERDKSCVYCGCKFGSERAKKRSWEHIINDITITGLDNIALCCVGCNASRGRLRKRKIKYVKPLAWPPLSQTIIFKKPP